MTRPLPTVTPNTWEFLRDAMIAPTGFREYDARWKYPDEINLPGMTALGLGLGTQIHKRGLKPEIAVGKGPEMALLDLKRTDPEAAFRMLEDMAVKSGAIAVPHRHR